MKKLILMAALLLSCGTYDYPIQYPMDEVEEDDPFFDAFYQHCSEEMLPICFKGIRFEIKKTVEEVTSVSCKCI